MLALLDNAALEERNLAGRMWGKSISLDDQRSVRGCGVHSPLPASEPIDPRSIRKTPKASGPVRLSPERLDPPTACCYKTLLAPYGTCPDPACRNDRTFRWCI